MYTTLVPTQAIYTEQYRDNFRVELIHDRARNAWRTTVHRTDAPDSWQLEVPGAAGDHGHALYVARTLADIAAAPAPRPAHF